jgi:hypothetical protein
LPDTLFVTGRLAEPALRGVVSELGLSHDIVVLNISVAALMTTRWIAKRLRVPAGVDNIVIPGLCEGDVDILAQATGLPVRKGPADVRALPEWYGREAVRAELGPRDVRVFAEINDVQSLTREQVIDRADAYGAQGADVIDLGLGLDRPWLTDGPATIAALRERGLSVSIDTLDPDHIRMADAAGVDYVLSLTPETIDLAAQLRATPVLISTEPDDLDGLDRLAGRMEQLGRPYLLDSILAPINSGFAASLARYVEVRRRHPRAEILMGAGNLRPCSPHRSCTWPSARPGPPSTSTPAWSRPGTSRCARHRRRSCAPCTPRSRTETGGCSPTPIGCMPSTAGGSCGARTCSPCSTSSACRTPRMRSTSARN